jgi:valyl-tRNA synthetase
MKSLTLPSVYQPHDVEEKWYMRWEKKGLFHAHVNPSKKPFSILIPPPNVTGSLHMGHALNNTLQDILIRWKKMEGYETCWFPGTDHAGIATQMVVERELKKEGKSRHELGREEFIKRVWAWKEKYGGIIDSQLKKLGASCDWERYAFTMDEKRARAVKEAFVALYEKGYIYRGLRHVNWCVRCLTALSDLEVEHREQEALGMLYYLRYPLANSPDEFIVIATTRPETILADVAIAVNPRDTRYKHLIGKEAILPIVGRRLKIIADEWADPNVGTGAVKITPAHDPNDFEVGKRHNLPSIVVINKMGKMDVSEILREEGISKDAKDKIAKYDRLDRFECRKNIIEDLKNLPAFEKEEPWPSNPGRCSRCGEIIESMLSVQWFMKMEELAKPAIQVVKEGKVRFHPERFSKLYLDWMQNLRDWCISRQLWWGHRIPAWYCLRCNQGADFVEPMPGKGEITTGFSVQDGWTNENLIQPQYRHWKYSEKAHVIVAKEPPKNCPVCGSTKLIQDDDVLDTWFSSALWPLSTMGWPEETEDLNYFYPTDVLSTARDIIYLWVARMIMMGLEFKKEIPFRDVYIHSTILDREGKRMSKSKGTGVDPLILIEKYGADATRFGLVLMCQGQDVRFNEEKIEQARNFANKIWNASRFVLANLPESPQDFSFNEKDGSWKFFDSWILQRLSTLIEEVTKHLQEFEFGLAATLLYDFFWDDFCDWYLELCKNDLQSNDEKRKRIVQGILLNVLSTSLKLLHPFMPFLTEEIWSNLQKNENYLLESSWPKPNWKEKNPGVLKKMELFMETAKGIRNLRGDLDLKPTDWADIEIHTSNISLFQELKFDLEFLTRSKITLHPRDGKMVLHAISYPFSEGILFLLLNESFNLQEEREKKEKEKAETLAELERVRKILSNPLFLEKAKKEVVTREQEKEKLLLEKLSKIEERLKLLSQ